MKSLLKKIIMAFIVAFISILNIKDASTLSDKTCGVIFVDNKYVELRFDTDGLYKIPNMRYCDSEKCNKGTIKLPTIKREGYKFLGWYADKELTIKLNDEFDKESDTKKLSLVPNGKGCSVGGTYAYVYAKFEEIDACEVKERDKIIHLETGTKEKIDDVEVCKNCNKVTINLPELKREGYEFLGWYTDNNFVHKLESNNVEAKEVYENMKFKVIRDKKKKCTDTEEGTIYARWVTKNEFVNYISDYTDNMFYYVKDITK